MMAIIEINTHPSRRDLLWFGLLLPAALSGACFAFLFAASDFALPDFVSSVGRKFNVYADGQGSNSLTPASMATFELHTASKMNAVTGAPGAGFGEDIVSITYLNAAAGGGVSVFNLGS